MRHLRPPARAVPVGTLEVGALGALEFDSGTYAYVGSAFGPGGFARVERHRELARGSQTRHWHVDSLLCDPDASLERVVLFPGEDRERALASALPGEPVAGVGAADCDCEAHLLSAPDRGRLIAAAREAGGTLEEEYGGDPEARVRGLSGGPSTASPRDPRTMATAVRGASTWIRPRAIRSRHSRSRWR